MSECFGTSYSKELQKEDLDPNSFHVSLQSLQNTLKASGKTFQSSAKLNDKQNLFHGYFYNIGGRGEEVNSVFFHFLIEYHSSNNSFDMINSMIL